MKFNEKLFELRKKAGMTQQDLAEKLNVSRQAVSRWEMGTAMPDVENLIAMSELFSVSLDYLLKEQAEPVQSQPGAETKRRKIIEILTIVIMGLLVLWIVFTMLERSRFTLILQPLVAVGACVAAVKMVHYLK